MGRQGFKSDFANCVKSEDNTCNYRGKSLITCMDANLFTRLNGNFGDNCYTFERGKTKSVIDYAFSRGVEDISF